jgi:hypothetical protein
MAEVGCAQPGVSVRFMTFGLVPAYELTALHHSRGSDESPQVGFWEQSAPRVLN